MEVAQLAKMLEVLQENPVQACFFVPFNREPKMTTKYATHISTKATPQSEPIPGRSEMIANNAGGFTFKVDHWAQMQRFCILGSSGGSYYCSEKKMTQENAACVTKCLDEDPAKAVQLIVDISVAGRAPKNDPAVFALAIAASHKNPVARKLALDVLPKVARIGTALFQFVAACNELRGWGTGLKKGIAAWYESQDPQKLAYGVAKYAQREGWSHKDVLRLAHPKFEISWEGCGLEEDAFKTASAQVASKEAIARWVLGQKTDEPRTIKNTKTGQERAYGPAGALPEFLVAVDEAKTASVDRLCALVRQHNLPREVIPTEKLNEIKVWEALSEKMPLTAMVRNLGKMTSIGLIKPMSVTAGSVAARITDQEYIRKSRLHPMAILLAAKVYAQGRGDKGKLTWTPVSTINDALDAAFYKAFANVEPTGKRVLLALDVSGSMSASVAGSSLSCREAAAAMAIVTAKTEPLHQIVAFTASKTGQVGGMHSRGIHEDAQLTPLDISSMSRLTDVVHKTALLPMGGTDCGLPMRWALEKGVDVDAFVVLTDNETWAGVHGHPCQLLQQYRNKRNIPAKLIVQAFTASPFSIADPEDAGSMDIVGLDSSTPMIMADFIRGGAPAKKVVTEDEI